MATKTTFKLTIMTPDALVYEGYIYSVFITGDKGEYELLPYHYPVLGVLKEGNIIINWEFNVPIKVGVVRFFANDCIILMEQAAQLKRRIQKKEVDMVFAEEKD